MQWSGRFTQVLLYILIYNHWVCELHVQIRGLLSVTSESMCTKYWLTVCSSLPGKSVVSRTDRPAMTIAVDLGRKATNKQNKLTTFFSFSPFF